MLPYPANFSLKITCSSSKYVDSILLTLPDITGGVYIYVLIYVYTFNMYGPNL